MENKNYFYNDAKEDLDDAFNVYYDLTFGIFDFEQPQEPKIRNLSKVVKNEVFDKNGRLYGLFEKMGKIKNEIYDLEYG